MSDSDESPKENILRIMDDFLSHLNQTKKFFMVLIFASFAIAPLSIVLMVVILTPSFVTQAGQPYEVTVSLVGQPVHDVLFAPPDVWMNESNFTSSGEVGTVLVKGIRVTPSGEHEFVMIKEGSPQTNHNVTKIMLNKSDVKLEYMPANHFEFKTFSAAPPPKFMYVGDVGHFGRQTDVTFLVVIVVIVSAALAITWLALGLKEYKFFSKWNQRYSKYRKLQENLDKELEE